MFGMFFFIIFIIFSLQDTLYFAVVMHNLAFFVCCYCWINPFYGYFYFSTANRAQKGIGVVCLNCIRDFHFQTPINYKKRMRFPFHHIDTTAPSCCLSHLHIAHQSHHHWHDKGLKRLYVYWKHGSNQFINSIKVFVVLQSARLWCKYQVNPCWIRFNNLSLCVCVYV